MTRLIALIILVIPGIVSAYGVKLMRDAIFSELSNPFSSIWIQFLFGFLIFLAGVFFIGGFIYRRDKKRKKVTKRLGRKRCTDYN
ncbi:DUF2627 domain-containing protein [Fervidibacillus halotolerans]|uniref:DUF2627 domain-containing protein n=1 Tax=Fervidibacillus halotolerans TaxID=2980027 RepID=A0A9E8LXD4_9BACI|nr:DUF2627 domain-containing protein [Fervidibacillus halotolerans]WAA11410.1 DUF2627 domain-containing protein [Fervidibacillus halotolerans]